MHQYFVRFLIGKKLEMIISTGHQSVILPSYYYFYSFPETAICKLLASQADRIWPILSPLKIIKTFLKPELFRPFEPPLSTSSLFHQKLSF